MTVRQLSVHWQGRDRGFEMQQVDLVGSLGLVLLISALTVLGYRINHVV
ncbi:putative conserved membrane protein [Synechococcus sp. A15-28]|nr:putative conserved membrane protein [Synechococcus sp. A15-28]